MRNRYNNIERTGVYETGRIVSVDLLINEFAVSKEMAIKVRDKIELVK